MKTITTTRQVEIIIEMFDRYVEHVASSFMCGEVPSTVFAVHRRGTKERDWLAMIRFKNTLTISIFRCEVWLEDIVRLCRRCKIWLLTDEIYKIISLYFMLHPLYQTQYIDFSHEIDSDYESMMAGAGKATYKFILRHFNFEDRIQKVVLEILNYHNMMFTNHFYGPNKDNVGEAYEIERKKYVELMMARQPLAYKTAIHYKASTSLVDQDGFIHLARTADIGGTRYVRQEDDRNQSLNEQKREDNPAKRPFSQQPDRSVRGRQSSNTANPHQLKPTHYGKSQLAARSFNKGARDAPGSDRI